MSSLLGREDKLNGEIVIGDVEYDGRVVLYIIKADETSYINYIKPLILAHELKIPHVIALIDTTSQWAYQIHPERMVPALKDRDSQTGEQINVFEGTACLQYLADMFDVDGVWSGRTAAERAAVFTWTAYQTAGIGLHENVLKQWDVINNRLAIQGQQYIALQDRPTLADLSYFPFAMPWMFAFLGVDIKDWPHIREWADRMLARPAIQDIMARAKTFGHSMTVAETLALKEAV
ncbi:putative glutathione S-transferase GliG-like protein [Trichoderma cornu-damae]|uniref:glutathione transferase n=1 Tax=Trichoderma cornu-damae TaxID=654480 RepID=A0A9P8QL61_9HYPO|nr:putative glutathione S-transferase GliG-like protein [Trichoderma cornu-damae]